MSDLDAVGREIEREASAVIDSVEELSTQDPWLSLPDDLRLDHLVPLLQLMVRSGAGIGPDPTGPRDVIGAALEHGRQRRQHGFNEEALLKEYHLLRRAVWRFLRVRTAPDGNAAEMMLRLDAEITTATSASLLGYHADEVDATRLERAVEEMVRRRREGGLPALSPDEEEP